MEAGPRGRELLNSLLCVLCMTAAGGAAADLLLDVISLSEVALANKDNLANIRFVDRQERYSTLHLSTHSSPLQGDLYNSSPLSADLYNKVHLGTHLGCNNW